MFCTEIVLQRNLRRYLQFYAGSLQNFGLCVRVTQKYAHTQSQPPEINRDRNLLLSDPGLFISQRQVMRNK